MTNEVFLDTAYAIALSAASDEFHEQAIRIAQDLEATKARLVTTSAVLLEIGNALSKLRYRRAAMLLLDSLMADPNVEVIALSPELFEKAHQLYRSRPDKEWGLTDCVSFVVMQERGITQALTTDHHFQQAGFQVLLRDYPPRTSH